MVNNIALTQFNYGRAFNLLYFSTLNYEQEDGQIIDQLRFTRFM